MILIRNKHFVTEKSEVRDMRGVNSDKFSHMISTLMEFSLGWKGIQEKRNVSFSLIGSIILFLPV